MRFIRSKYRKSSTVNKVFNDVHAAACSAEDAVEDALVVVVLPRAPCI